MLPRSTPLAAKSHSLQSLLNLKVHHILSVWPKEWEEMTLGGDPTNVHAKPASIELKEAAATINEYRRNAAADINEFGKLLTKGLRLTVPPSGRIIMCVAKILKLDTQMILDKKLQKVRTMLTHKMREAKSRQRRAQPAKGREGKPDWRQTASKTQVRCHANIQPDGVIQFDTHQTFTLSTPLRSKSTTWRKRLPRSQRAREKW